MDVLEFRRHQAELIAEHGFTLVGVFDPDGKEPNFAYSIGLTERGWPEVLLIGNIRPEFMEILLTDLINRWKAADKVIMGDNADLIAFPDGTSHAMRVIEADTDIALDSYACQVSVFFDESCVKVVQVLWPDKNGVFPNEPGYDTTLAQPIIDGRS